MSEQNPRFGGIARLYGTLAAEKIQSARIAVVGIGGVGSWIAECLARTGVRNIILMDMDDICITNINRQLHATTESIGKMKVTAMGERIRAINPEAQVTELSSFYTEANANILFDCKPDIIIDAIDVRLPKAHLIATCYERKQAIITCGGSGGKIDPTKIQVADLSKSHGDPLLSLLRKTLHKDYLLPLGAKPKKLYIPCVFSPEKPMFPTCDGSVSETRDPAFQGRMACDAGFGSASHITASFGFFACAEAFKQLTNNTI